MKNTLLVFSIGAALLFCSMKSGAQGMAVNTSGAAANSSAIMDVSSTTQGMLIPRMTNAQLTAISSPATGLLVYQTDGTPGFYFFDGGSWVSLNTPSGSPSSGDLTGSYPNPTISSSAGTGNNIVTAINASGGGLSGTKLATTSVSVNAMSATGTRNSTTYLRGDNTWATVSGGSGTVTSVSSGVLTSGTTAFTDTIFRTSVSTATTTPSITYSFTNAAAATVLTNSLTGTPAVPVYGKVVPQALYAPGGGTPSSSTYYRGDGQWATPSSGGGYALGGVEYFTQNKASYFSSITTDNSASSFAVSDVGFPIPVTGTLSAIAVSGDCTATYVSGGTNVVTFTIYQNGSATSTTGTITFPNSATVGQRFSNVTSTSLSVTAGDILAIDISQSNYTNGAIGKTSVVLYFN